VSLYPVLRCEQCALQAVVSIHPCCTAERESQLAEADKAAVRANLLEGIASSPPAVRAQLGECARYVVYSDFPAKWPQLQDQVLLSLSSQVTAPTRAEGPDRSAGIARGAGIARATIWGTAALWGP
jgi:hypothetical protein